MLRWILPLVGLLVVGCEKDARSRDPAAGGERGVAAAPAPADAAPAAAVVADAAVAPVVAVVVADAAPAGPPPDAAPAIKTWPFTAWDRAEAITFNHMRYGPRIQLYVYTAEKGWSPNIVERYPLTVEQGKRAVGWTIETRGELEVSKCPFPRHAVVLYAGDTPVGTVNVCFECGDILVWPPFETLPEDQDKLNALWSKQMKAYDRVFPKWQAFFRDEVGVPLEPVER
jgi:hypothetical protein